MEIAWHSLLEAFTAACATLALLVACIALVRAYMIKAPGEGDPEVDRLANLGAGLFRHWGG